MLEPSRVEACGTIVSPYHTPCINIREIDYIDSDIDLVNNIDRALASPVHTIQVDVRTRCV